MPRSIPRYSQEKSPLRNQNGWTNKNLGTCFSDGYPIRTLGRVIIGIVQEQRKISYPMPCIPHLVTRLKEARWCITHCGPVGKMGGFLGGFLGRSFGGVGEASDLSSYEVQTRSCGVPYCLMVSLSLTRCRSQRTEQRKTADEKAQCFR